MKISIVTISLNNKDELLKTIISVRNQSFSNYEHIIIDGKSDYNVAELLHYNKQKITLISEKDKGIYDAMNKGLNLARNDFIIFLNSGDYFYSDNTLENVQKAYSKSVVKPLFIYGDACEINSKNEIYLKKARNENMRITGMFTHHQAMFYKKEVIRSLSIFYNTDYKIAADYEFTLNFIINIKQEEKLKLNFPICIFSLDGASTIYNKRGFIEQYKIKKKFFPIVLVIPISVIQYILIKIRKLFPTIYKIYRYI